MTFAGLAQRRCNDWVSALKLQKQFCTTCLERAAVLQAFISSTIGRLSAARL